MVGRPKGSKDSYKRDYTVTPAAYNQKTSNLANIHGKSFIIDKVIQDSSLSDQEKEMLREERLSLWRKLSSPVLLLTDKYAELDTLIKLKQAEGEYLGKEVLMASKILLDIAKEVNRLTQVSADKKLDVYSKTWGGGDDIVIDVGANGTDDNEDKSM